MATVSVKLTGDATSLIGAMKSAGISVEGFEKTAKSAEKSTGGFSSEVKKLGAELLGGLALGTIISQTVQFANASEQAARSQRDAFGALTTAVSGITTFSEAMASAKAVTNGMVSETQLASSLSVIYGAGLASNAQEAARLAQAGTVLTSVFASAGASQELYVRLLSSGSIQLFNNFGLTAQLVNEKQKEIEATTNLSGAEARQQAVKEALLDTADKYQAALSAETVAAQQAAAAYDDMQARLGQALVPAYAAAREEAAGFFGELAIAVEGVNLMADTLGRLQENTDANALASQSLLDRYLELNPLFGLIKGNQDTLSESLTTAAHWVIENTIGWDELANRYNTGVEQSAEVVTALEEQVEGYEDTAAAIAYTAEQLGDLAMTQADYINDIGELEQDRRDTFRNISEEMVDINATTSEKIRDAETSREEALSRLLEKYKNDRNRAISSGHTERLSEIERAYQDEKQKTITHYDELVSETKTGAEKRRQELIQQQNEERAEFDKHVQELKLKAVLGVLETTGQLESLTGGVTTSANDAFKLIQAGVIPVTGEFQQAIAAYTQQLTQASSDYKGTQLSNTAAIDSALSGTTQLTQDQIQAMGYELPRAGDNAKNTLVRDFNEAASAVGRTTSQADGLTQSLVQTENQARRTAAAVQSIGTGGSGRIPGYASGGDFVVPAGFPNDSYLMGVSTGERVIVQPQQTTNYNLNVSSSMPSAGLERDFQLMRARG